MTDPSDSPSRLLYGLVIAPAAFLLFLVQPMVARAILPWFGGAAAVWVTCLLFFQVALLGGYVYAHGLARWARPGMQAAVHVALLAAAVALLPVNPSAAWKPGGAEDPVLRILGLLTVSLGLPCVLLAATSPLLQAWFARAEPEGLPWGLFAVSNAGSLAALLLYPVAVEPFLGVTRQMHLWSGGFAGVAALTALVAWRSARTAAAERPALAPSAVPARGVRALWVLLPACAVVLLMSVSTHLTQNVAPVPFLWVLPLALYLLTFILCFDGHGWYRRGRFVPALLLAIGAMTLFLGPETEAASLWILLPVFAAGLFAGCMVCHGELERLKPAPDRLTAFYLAIAAGGALGGTLVALAAPRLFSGPWELPLGLAACAALALAALRLNPSDSLPAPLFRTAWHGAVVLALLAALGLGIQVVRVRARQRLMVRDFYGGLRVADRPGPHGARVLLHGIINHGEQSLDPARRRHPTSYYSPWSGAALAVTHAPRPEHQSVGVIGLGTGTLAAYGRAGDEYRFYEINPLIVKLARTEFTFLADSEARVEVVLGDGRLSLEREADRGFDVLLVDAFAGDAIPMHLLTREAFTLYRRHLRPGGTLALHITNKYLDLAPVAAQGAEILGLRALEVWAAADPPNGWNASLWVLLLDRPDSVPLDARFNAARTLFADPERRPWTDDWSNLLGVLSRHGSGGRKP